MAPSLRSLALAGLMAAGLAGTAHAQFYPPVPPLRYEAVPVAPGEAYLWEPGHWHWNGYRYVWFGGHYIGRRVGYSHYIPGHWGPRYGRWVWVPAHWG